MTESVSNQKFNNQMYIRQNQPLSTQSMGQSGNDAMAMSTEVVANNPLVRSTSKKRPSDALVTAALAVPTYAGFYYGVDALNKKMQGNYKDTLLGKLATKGNAIEENKLYQATIGRARNWTMSAGRWIDTNIIEKSNVLKAFKTPVSAEWSWAKTQSGGLKGFAGTDNVDIIDKVINSHARKELEPKALAKKVKLGDYISDNAAEFSQVRSKYLKKLFNLFVTYG